MAKIKFWNSKLEGRIGLYGNDFGTKKKSRIGYSTTLGTKNDDGDYENYYLNVSFSKDADPGITGPFKVDISEAFLTCYVDKKGETHPKLVIVDADVVEDDEDEKPKKKKPAAKKPTAKKKKPSEWEDEDDEEDDEDDEDDELPFR